MKHDSTDRQPVFVTRLEGIYGGPSQAGFGSAVFFEERDLNADLVDLEQAARDRYRYFCGEIWTRFGEENWLRAWNQVYVRGTGFTGDFVDELSSLDDRTARQSALMLCDNLTTSDARTVVNNAFGGAVVADLRIYTIGDGAAMSGLLVAARRCEGDLFLAFLLD